MEMNIEKIKSTTKLITWTILGIIYFPIFFTFWVLRFVSRFVLAISYYGTFNNLMGSKVMKTLFSKEYERNF